MFESFQRAVLGREGSPRAFLRHVQALCAIAGSAEGWGRVMQRTTVKEMLTLTRHCGMTKTSPRNPRSGNPTQ